MILFNFISLELKVIWQYGKRGEANQTVLTVGGTQVESNYRIRIITNATNEETFLPANDAQTDDRYHQSSGGGKITINNLEIRKLQVSDSGWYECQLPTKPTQINYIYLEVLGKHQLFKLREN
jgi:hypothetical protein